MAWRWLIVAFVLVGATLWLSDPRRVRQYLSGIVISIIVGLLLEFGLSEVRPVWNQANILLPLFGREAIWLFLFYGVQGLLFFQFLPKHIAILQAPYAIVCALGTAGFEQILASLHLFGAGGWKVLFLSFLVHSLRLLAFVGLFHAVHLGEPSDIPTWHEDTPWRFRAANKIWLITWPSMAAMAWTMMKVTQRMAKYPR